MNKKMYLLLLLCLLSAGNACGTGNLITNFIKKLIKKTKITKLHKTTSSNKSDLIETVKTFIDKATNSNETNSAKKVKKLIEEVHTYLIKNNKNLDKLSSQEWCEMKNQFFTLQTEQQSNDMQNLIKNADITQVRNLLDEKVDLFKNTSKTCELFTTFANQCFKTKTMK